MMLLPANVITFWILIILQSRWKVTFRTYENPIKTALKYK